MLSTSWIMKHALSFAIHATTTLMPRHEGLEMRWRIISVFQAALYPLHSPTGTLIPKERKSSSLLACRWCSFPPWRKAAATLWVKCGKMLSTRTCEAYSRRERHAQAAIVHMEDDLMPFETGCQPKVHVATPSLSNQVAVQRKSFQMYDFLVQHCPPKLTEI